MKMVTENRAVLGFNLSFLFDRTDVLHTSMNQLLQWYEEGRIKVMAVQQYPAHNAKVKRVFRRREERHTIMPGREDVCHGGVYMGGTDDRIVVCDFR